MSSENNKDHFVQCRGCGLRLYPHLSPDRIFINRYVTAILELLHMRPDNSSNRWNGSLPVLEQISLLYRGIIAPPPGSLQQQFYCTFCFHEPYDQSNASTRARCEVTYNDDEKVFVTVMPIRQHSSPMSYLSERCGEIVHYRQQEAEISTEFFDCLKECLKGYSHRSLGNWNASPDCAFFWCGNILPPTALMNRLRRTHNLLFSPPLHEIEFTEKLSPWSDSDSDEEEDTDDESQENAEDNSDEESDGKENDGLTSIDAQISQLERERKYDEEQIVMINERLEANKRKRQELVDDLQQRIKRLK